MFRRWGLLGLALISVACGDDPVGSLDSGGGDAAIRDRGVDTGAGPTDTGPRDLSGPTDTGADLGLSDIVDPGDVGPEDLGPGDSGEIDEDAGPSCIPDEACTNNPNAPCRLGRIDCSSGTAVCVDDAPADDGTSCPNGACVTGQCLLPTVIIEDQNLSQDTITPNRSCAEAPQYSVVALTDLEATLTATPTADCLAPGDEVLLINLQGAPGATDNVGVFETLVVDQVLSFGVRFTSAKTRFYGSAAGSDQDLGTSDGQQKVALIRVPKYGSLSIEANATVTADPWNGVSGGVLAFRSAALNVDGRLSAEGLGYRPGRWSQDSGDCDDNVATESGESIAGSGAASTLRNVGGSGGISALDNVTFNGNTPVSASAGHATAGQAGLNPVGRTLGEPGEAYGVSDGTRLTMGSGPGGNLTCDTGVVTPLLIPVGPRAGGIVLIFSGDITVSTSGEISADAPPPSRDVAPSGGYVLLHGRDIQLGEERVSAKGAVGQSINVSGPVSMNEASPGYVVVEYTGTVTGTTSPEATFIQR